VDDKWKAGRRQFFDKKDKQINKKLKKVKLTLSELNNILRKNK